eukprot:m.91637 g.91637  ORF g.91637 m.91637 type:complete len:272 (-) comp51148_c0_seq21:384-1199(-)
MMLVMWLIVLGVGVVQLPFLADLFGGSRWTDTRTSRALVLLVAALCSAALAIFYFAFFPAAVHSFGSDAQLWWITWIYIVAVIVLWPNTVYNYAAAVMVLPRTISVEVEATEQTVRRRARFLYLHDQPRLLNSAVRRTRVDRSKSIKMMTMMTRLKYLLPPLPAFASDASAENRPEFITVECASAVLTLIIVRIANSLLISRFSFFILMGSSLSLLLSRTLSLVLRLPLHRQLRWQRKLCLLFSISCACERRPDFGHGDDCQSFHQVLGHL